MPAPTQPRLPPISFLRMRRFMAQWETEGDWSKGILRDPPRASIPMGGLYNAIDFQLDSPGIAYKRGGTFYAGPVLTAATQARAIVWANYIAGAQLLAIGDNGHLYKVTSGATTDINTLGAAYIPVCKPVYHHGGTKEYVIIPTSDGSASPKHYNGSVVSAMVATVPKGTICATYKGRLVLANDHVNKVRLWFSPATVAGGADLDQAWDATNAWVDADFPVTGLAPLQNSLLIFSHEQTERLTGTTPPPGTDFDHAPVGAIGCSDARSISIWQNYALFANPRSIFMTNGVGFKDLLQEAGLVRYWQGILSGYSSSTWTIATGILWDKFLFVSVMNGNTFVDCLISNLARNAWWRFSNIKAAMFTAAVGLRDELYYADLSAPRATGASGCWFPAASNKVDADGTTIAPVLETKVLQPTPNVKTYGRCWIDYDLRDAATDNPTLAVQVAPGVEATTFSTVPESPLPESTDEIRKTITAAKTSQGLTMRLTQNGPSAKTEIYALELETLSVGQEYGTQ
jgi:hypothetical protein